MSGFQPTPRHERFREIAATCVRNSNGPPALARAMAVPGGDQGDETITPTGLLVADWLRWAQFLMDDWPTMVEWRRWEKDPAFTAWFLEEIPEYEQATLLDLQALDATMFRALMSGMARGDPDHLKIYAGIFKARKEADDTAQTELLETIRQARASSRWKPPEPGQ